MNLFHSTTRARRIEHDVLLRVGDPYHQYLVDETVRVLYGYQQLSLVLAIPIRGSKPDTVKLLVVTKDTWSLRTQFEMKLGSGGLDLLRLEPTERNIAGQLRSALGRFELFPENLNLGAGYYSPRFVPGWYLVVDANVSFERATGKPEGTAGGVALFQPLNSSDQKWAWQVGTRWSNTVVRRYVDAKLARFDADVTPEDDAIPDQWRQRSAVTSVSGVRSVGAARKFDFMGGLELNVRRGVGLDPSRYAPEVVREYDAKRVVTDSDRLGPFVQGRVYESRFVRLHDVDLLGLGEDFRLGYDALLRVYPVVAGSTRLIGVDALAQYVWGIGDGFFRATGEALYEQAAERVVTSAYAADVVLVSPSLPFGRLVVDGVGFARPVNTLNIRNGLGGEGRLRGYPSGAFLGENFVAYNAEVRTKPIEILSCQVGAALFHDLGDAFDGNDIRVKSSAGFGLRALFPQLDRRVWRLDVAFPLVRTGGEGPVGFYLSF